MHKSKVLKLKAFITLQDILFINNCLVEERMKSFNTTFKQKENNQFHYAESINTHQLERLDFKTETYGCFSVMNKCLSASNLLQKTNF